MDDELWEVYIDEAVQPVDLDTLKAWIECARVGPEDKVRKGAHPWTAVRLVPQLRGIEVDGDKAEAERLRRLGTHLPVVPMGTAKCWGCGAEVLAEATKCGTCGNDLVSAEWSGFLDRYNAASDEDRKRYWALLEAQGQEYLRLVITARQAQGKEAQKTEVAAKPPQKIPRGAISCPNCGGPAFGGRDGCLICLMILTFPIGLLLLLVKPTYKCRSCGWTFKT